MSYHKINTNILFLLTILLIVGMASCGRKNKTTIDNKQVKEKIEGDTASVSQKREITKFSSVCIYDASQVNITVAPQYSVKINGPKSYVDACQTMNNGDNLTIKFDDYDTQYRMTSVDITAPSLNELEVTGCGMLNIAGGKLQGNQLYMELKHISVVHDNAKLTINNSVTLKLADVGYANFSLDCRRLDFFADRIEHVKLMGKAGRSYFYCENLNQVETNNLKTKIASKN
jgi:hypothetical protein